MGHQLLHLDSQGMRAYCWHRKAIHMEAEFPTDAGGFDAFETYLKHRQRSTFRLLADLTEESHRIDLIPSLRGKDRKALIERRCSQYFPDTAMTCNTLLGYDNTDRRQEKILFSAFTRPADFEPWLNIMGKMKSRLAGIHSTALTSRCLAKLLPIDLGSTLLLNLGRGGLRQTCFQQGQFRFSRLTPLAKQTPEDLALSCILESEKLYQYLMGQEMLEWQEPLSIIVFADGAQADSLRQCCRNSTELSFSIIELQDIVRKAGLKFDRAVGDSETLFLHLLANKRSPPQFAPHDIRFYARLHRIRHGLRLGGACLSAGAMIFASVQAAVIQGLQQEIEASRHQLQLSREQLDSILRSLPPLPTNMKALETLIALHDALVHQSPTPRELYTSLGIALTRLPQLELRRIDWFLAANQNQSANPIPVASEEKAAVAIARVEIHLSVTMATDHRSRLQTIEELKNILGEDPHLSTLIQPHPASVASNTVLTSSQAASTEPLPLTLLISRRLP